MSNVMDEYLEGLVKEASQKSVEEAHMETVSISELAEMAGIKLAASTCSKCGSQMEKTGAIFKCSACGMMKKAQKKPVPPALKRRAAVVKAVQDPARPGAETPPPGVLKKAEKKVVPPALKRRAAVVKAVQDPARPGAETPPPGVLKSAATKCGSCGMEKHESADGVKCGCGVKIAKKDMPGFLEQDRPKKVKEIYSALKREHPDMPAEMKARIAARQGKRGKQKQGPPYKGPIKSWKEKESGKKEAAFDPLHGDPRYVAVKDPAKRLAIAASQALKGGGKLPKWLLPAALGVGAATGTGAGLYLGLKKEKKKTASVDLAVALCYEGFDKTAASQLAVISTQEDFDLKKIAVRLLDGGMDKEAIWPVIQALGRAAKGAFQVGRTGGLRAGAEAGKRGLQWTGATAREMGRGVGQTYRGARAGGATIPGAAWQTAAAHPGLSIPAAAAGGYGVSKLGSADALVAVADAAGRLLAKTAQAPLDVEELKESIEEAQAREDIPGRARRWQIGGGVTGGLAGAGVPLAAGALLKRPGLGALAALPTAAGGAYLGQRLGRAHGAEEAIADKAVSMLRAMRAGQTGARAGYRAGFTRGMATGRPPFAEGR